MSVVVLAVVLAEAAIVIPTTNVFRKRQRGVAAAERAVVPMVPDSVVRGVVAEPTRCTARGGPERLARDSH
jgi:hypothetical protein